MAAIVLLLFYGFNQGHPVQSSCRVPAMLALHQSPQSEPHGARDHVRPLTEADAIDIWIARWLRIRRRDLCLRYGCDPRRLYEIWEGTRFPTAQIKARNLFAARYPGIIDRIDFGHHKRLSREVHPDQLAFFD